MPGRRQRWSLRIALLVGLCAAVVGRGATPPPVQLDYFYEAGCPACRAVDAELLRLSEALDGLYTLRRWEIGVQTNFLRLVAYQERLGISGDAPVTVVVDQRVALEGVAAIRAGLLRAVVDAIEARHSADEEGRVFVPDPPIEPATVQQVAERAADFTWLWVAVAGLADGLNPCAFATIVFLTTLLAAGGRRARAMFVGGLAFCLASFVTYFLIGVGLLTFLQQMEGRTVLRQVVEWGTVAALCVFGVLSLRDAWRYGRSGDARSVTLQLPGRVKNRIRRFARARWRGPAVFGTGLVLGSGVTVLESVCTGQLYLPTLVVMAREGGPSRVWGLLALYNAAFIVPLFSVFLLGVAGVRSERLAGWTRRNVVPSKLLLAAVFFGLALLLVFQQ